MHRLLFPILLLAPAAYSPAQQSTLPPTPQPVAQFARQSDFLAAPQLDSRAATLPVEQPAPRPDLEAALQPASQAAQQPAPQAAPQPVSNSALPRAGSDWQMVEALPAGTTLYVNAKGGHKACKLKSATADTLTCAEPGKDAVYPRAEIWAIKIGHRGRSALIGAIPGGALMAGGGIAFATEHCSNQVFLSFCGLGPAVAVAGGGAIAILGATIGGLTDFSKSTIYTAP
jgi:hypothetical protein